MVKLFTIGKYQLGHDGEHIPDENGLPIQAYSIDDIKEYARVWTGFRTSKIRGNIGNAVENTIDPMYIDATERDVFPKLGLDQSYVGDGYPLCADQPQHQFLKRGAKYILLGSSPSPEMQSDPSSWENSTEAVRFVADPEGELNSVLCGRERTSNLCWYPPVVTLQDNLRCFGLECDVDTVRVVQVEGGIFYEYVPVPCVYHTFFKDAQIIGKKSMSAEHKGSQMCGNPKTATAAAACCYDGENAYAYDTFWGERVRGAEAARRCSLKKERLCNSRLRIQNCQGTSCDGHQYYWMSPDSVCTLKAKFNRNEMVAVVHELGPEEVQREMEFAEQDSKTFFRVQYLSGGNKVKDLIRDCDANAGCSRSTDGYCMCEVAVSTQLVFGSIPTREEVLSILTVGSHYPDTLDDLYTRTTVGSVTVYTKNGIVTDETIFEVLDDYGVVHLRKNVLSVVSVGTTGISFRNPVQFMSFSEPTRRDAENEVDAAIDHLFYHPNTAVFLAIRLAQRFGISNPSPRYTKAIADAFREGTYVHTSGNDRVVFGNASYGDLAASVAATVLDREARSVLLDMDPFHGSLKEPLLKLIGLMRNLEFKPTPEFPFVRFLKDMQDSIGQMVYQAPDVYSYFDPEFRPNGDIANAGLVSPEAQVLSNFNIVGLMDGFLAMVKYGLDRCFDGFGESSIWKGKNRCQSRLPGEYSEASSYPHFVPSDASSPSSVVDELSTLMTSGRLNQHHRSLIEQAVAQEPDRMIGIIKAEQLMASIPEFHSTGTVTTSSERTQDAPESVSKSSKPYKALVVLMLAGGCDSFNLLVPKRCPGTNDGGVSVLDQYVSERGVIGLDDIERKLEIEAKNQNQPCDTFAVHPQLPVVQELYKSGDLSFFVNAGMIDRPSNSDTWRVATSTKLFDNHAMQRAAQLLDPYSLETPSGVLTRIANALKNTRYGLNPQTFSLNKPFLAVKTNSSTHELNPIIIHEDGPQAFNNKPKGEQFDPLDNIKKLNELSFGQSNLFGNLWSRALLRALSDNDFWSRALDGVELEVSCGSKALNMAVKLMETRQDRGKDRDMFFVEMGGWDNEFGTKAGLDEGFEQLNDDITCFVENVKQKGLWKNVTLLVVSEFGRTLVPTSNTSLKTGNGWAGHYFAIGGGVQGGVLHGQYPSDLTKSSMLQAGDGRIIPTLSWESIWFAMMEWMGVSIQEDLHALLPNARGTETKLLRKDEVFEQNL